MEREGVEKRGGGGMRIQIETGRRGWEEERRREQADEVEVGGDSVLMICSLSISHENNYRETFTLDMLLWEPSIYTTSYFLHSIDVLSSSEKSQF